MTFLTNDQKEEETWNDQQEDDDKDKNKGKDITKEEDKGIESELVRFEKI